MYLRRDRIAVDNLPFTVATITVGRLMKWYYDKDGLGERTNPELNAAALCIPRRVHHG